MERWTRHDDGELPVFDADAPLASLRRPGSPTFSGRRTGSARGIGIAVAAIVVLTAGVVVGGMLEPADPSAAPTSSGPASTDGPCVQTPLTRVPPFVIGVEGSTVTAPGRAGYSHRPDGEEQGPGWIVPSSASVIVEVPSGAAFEVRTSAGACVRHVLAEYASAELRDPAPADTTHLMDAEIEPASQSPTLGTLPDGDWVLRVLAQFDTGDTTAAGLVAGERYFRVRVGPGPFPSGQPAPSPRRPAVTPVADCRPAPAAVEDIDIVFSKAGSESVLGVPDGSSPPRVEVGLGDTGELAVVGDACATIWNITLVDTTTGDAVVVDSMVNPADDPAYAAQNHWRIAVDVGTFDLIASLHFGPSLDVVRVWRVVSTGFTIPPTMLRGDDGDDVLALPGCGFSFQLSNGYTSGDSCGSLGYPEGLEELHVPAWSRVTLLIPGWTISSWNGQCGQILVDGAGTSTFEYSCNVGGYSVDFGAFPPGPAQFLARPGSQVMQLWVSAIGAAGTFNGPMFAIVVGD